MSGDSMFAQPDPMAVAAANMNEAADLFDDIRADLYHQIAALRDPAWGHGDEISEIGKEKFDPGVEQIDDGLKTVSGAIRKVTESTINSAGMLGDTDMDNTDISYDLANGMPGGGSRR